MPELTGQILAAVGICFTAATLAMIGRVIARKMTKVAWWYEDYFCIVSYVSTDRTSPLSHVTKHSTNIMPR